MKLGRNLFPRHAVCWARWKWFLASVAFFPPRRAPRPARPLGRPPPPFHGAHRLTAPHRCTPPPYRRGPVNCPSKVADVCEPQSDTEFEGLGVCQKGYHCSSVQCARGFSSLSQHILASDTQFSRATHHLNRSSIYAAPNVDCRNIDRTVNC